MSVTEDGSVIRSSGRLDLWPAAAIGRAQAGPVMAAGLDTAIAQPAASPQPEAQAAAGTAAG